MISLLLSLVVLIIGYLVYGKLTEKIFAPDDRPTPAIAINDGVDCVPKKPQKSFLVQLLNIAGTGPIFGALMGACFGPVVFLWIIFGSILGGAVHDYMSGMISSRHGGSSIAELSGTYLGNTARWIMRIFSVVLLVLTGTFFVTSPAALIVNLFKDAQSDIAPVFLNMNTWVIIILLYYVLATLLPIDKLIGRFYPLFALCLLASSVCLIIALFMGNVPPFLNFTTENLHPKGLPLFPLLFVTIACGAISGFHATQSPMIARCLKDEKYGRPVFYGAMIVEGIVALIWATLGICFYPTTQHLLASINQVDAGGVVSEIAKGLLGNIGGIATIASVVILAITTGDTCFRSARLCLADFLKLPQEKIRFRLILSLVVLAGGVFLSVINVATIWRYFGWFNQTLAMCTLWLVTVYLRKAGKCFWISLVPAVFMTAVSSAYVAYDKLFLNLSIPVAHGLGVVVALISLVGFLGFYKKGNLKDSSLHSE